MHDSVINIYKPVGITPLQLIDQFRLKYPEYKDEKIGYAGRLDPLAHGVLSLLIGEENKQREKYLHLDKTYQFSVLFGLETDSYDFLGLLKNDHVNDVPADISQKIEKFIPTKLRKQTQMYPPFSSKAVNGKPLFWWAKRERLDEIAIPSREVEIFNFKLIKIEKIPKIIIQDNILTKVKSIQGYFRQEEIYHQWTQFFKINKLPEFTLATFEVHCSSGTYMRSLAHELGQTIEYGAISYEILRTQVGEYNLTDSLRL